MALPGLLVYFVCKPMIRSKKSWLNIVGGFIAGAGAVFGAGVLVALALYFSERGFASAAKAVLLAHIPIMIIEGVITAIAVSFIKKIKPEILLLVLIVTFASSSGFCHRVNIFCYVNGDKIECSSKFTPGGPVKNGEVIVKSVQTGELLLKTKTDEKGQVSFKIPDKALKNNWDLKIICNAEMGHRNFWIIKADEIAPARQTKEESQTLKTSEEETKAISKRELESVISEVMARQLAPIKRDLAELKQPRISLQDVIAGLGYIFGIAGIVMYFLQRRS
jgi:nickel transport protein